MTKEKIKDENVCWSVFMNMTQSRVTQEEGSSTEEFLSSEWPVDIPMDCVLHDGCVRAYSIVGSAWDLGHVKISK